MIGRRLRRQGGGPNSIGMAALVRLLTLFAFLLMPFTMATAGAHAMPQAMAERHCGDHGQQPAPATDMTQCLMMCAALPAAASLKIVAPDLPKAPVQFTVFRPIHGIILDIATPPPRLS